MKLFWNEQKNLLLKSTRNVGFDDVRSYIDSGAKYTLEAHPNQDKYPHQYVLCFEHHKYMFVVPCIAHEGGFFLKTIYPSRKLQKKRIS